MPPGWINSPTFPSNTNKTFVQVYLLQESDPKLGNWGTFQDVTNKNRHCMKFPTPKTHCAEGSFRMQYLFVLLTLQIKYQGQADYDITFQNSWQLTPGINTSTVLFTGQGFIFKCISLHDWKKTLRFTVFRLLENAIVKLPCHYHDLIINPPCRTVPQKIYTKQFVPCLPWKASPHTLWVETLCPCSIGKSCGSVSLNICKKVKNKTC